jgi:hypothetical protein
MDARQLLLSQHKFVHSSKAAAAAPGSQLIDHASANLSDAEFCQRLPGHTSIAWLLWHIARCEDVAVNLVMRRVPQVLDREDWAERIGIDRRDIGTGMTDDEVDAFDARVNVSSLWDYRDAVGTATKTWLETADLGVLDEIFPDAGRRAKLGGAFGDGAMWVVERWDGRGGAWFLSWLAVGHNFLHIAEIGHVRRLLGHVDR